MAGSAVYGCVRRKNGRFSSQLLFSRSRLCTQTIPRNELDACVLGAAAAECVRRSLGEKVAEDTLFVTDSEIAFCWISNPEKTLKIFCVQQSEGDLAMV